MKPAREHQRRFEADPTGLERAQHFLEEHGYHGLHLIKSQRRHHVFQASNEQEKKRFLKATNDPKEQIFLENEVRANDLLRPLTDGLDLRIPAGEYYASGDGAWIDQEFIEGQPVAHEDRLLQPFSDQELEVLFQFLRRKHELRERDIPEFFLQRGRTEFAPAAMAEKLEHLYLAPATGPVLAPFEAQRIKELFVSSGSAREFCHHDFVAWNMLRDQAGKVVLTDAEHARWGMRWYDLAYNYLQTRILLDEPEEAKRQLTFFVRRFREELPHEPIEKELLHPMAYWTGACAFMAANKPELKARVREVIEPILQGCIPDVEG
jgi:hypothetical protein